MVNQSVRYRVSIVHPLTLAEFGAGRNIPKKVVFGIAEVGSNRKAHRFEAPASNLILDRCIELMRVKFTIVEADAEMADKRGDWEVKVINAALLHFLPDATD